MRLGVTTLLVVWIVQAYGQVGGQESFSMLRLPDNSRTAALGGRHISSGVNESGMLWTQPALISDTVPVQISAQYTHFLSDIWMMALTGSWGLKPGGSVTLGLKYLDLGTIPARDDAGNLLGEFNAADYVLTASYNRGFGPFSMALSLNFIHSGIQDFGANALFFDLGGIYKHPRADLIVSMLFKNLGFVLSDYAESSNSQVPFDLQVGASFKPSEMPFRFSLTLHHLTTTDLNYSIPGTGNQNQLEDASTMERIFRHVTFGMELILHRSISIMAGYDQLKRQELRYENASGGSGISAGFQFRAAKWQLAYSWAGYGPAGAMNTVGLVILPAKW